MPPTKRRGSDTLLQAYKAGGFILAEDVIEGLAARIGDRPLHDILVKGQPVPDFVRTTFSGNAGDTGAFVGDLLDFLGQTNTPIPATVRIFPRGIPWPGEYIVDLVVAEQQF
jgi:hypothetical protein